MAILWSNNASSSISGSITATDTSVALAAGTGIEFPNPTGSDYYIATFYDQATKTRNEIVHVTAMAGDVATIVRGQEGTTPQAWNAGDIFANLITAGTLRAFVQAGTGPADTSVVYVGTDTGTQNHIVANTVPVPPSLAVGMLFNILVKNGNSGATDVQLNGLPALALTRNNGANLVGGDITASEEVTFVYNGVNFNTMIPDLLQHPPVTTFYVRPDGNDGNTGWANTPQDAFLTMYGAYNAITSRYSSQNTITLKVADGTYLGGFTVGNSYIASWNIVGNVSNPQNVVWDNTSVSPPPGSHDDTMPLRVQPSGVVEISGFTMKGWAYGVFCDGGSIDAHEMYWTASTGAGAPSVACTTGQIFMHGNHTFDIGSIAIDSLCHVTGGWLQIGQYNPPPWPSWPVTVNIIGNPSLGATVRANANGLMVIGTNSIVTWIGGTPVAPKYISDTGGGISTQGALNSIPGSLPGQVTAPGWAT